MRTPGFTASSEWISLSASAKKRDGVIVVSPQWLREAPTIAEVCVRKVGAEVTQDRFRSGTFAELTARLQDIPADVVYLLPLFLPGVMYMQTGEDVRKGSLGNVYAVRDFFQIDSELISPLGSVDLAMLVAEELVHSGEVEYLAAFAGMST